MRILHIHSGNRYGGVESVLRVMAQSTRLVESAFALSYEGRLAHELRSAGAEVHILGQARASRPFSVFRARAHLSTLVRERSFDASLVHSSWALALLAHSAALPLVFYQHDVFNGEDWIERLARHTHPDLILANSAFTARSTSVVFPGRHAQVLHPPAALPMTQARSRVHNGRVVILIAARFEAWKGHDLLLEALASLRQNPLWCLWIAGEPQTPNERELRDALQAKATVLGLGDRVLFLGHVSDVPALMQSADIYCQPNTGPEPFGLAFVEALACGLPVIATSLGGVREILEPIWGLLASPTPAAVAGMIARLLHDPDLCRRLGELGPPRARFLCDPETQIAALAHSIEAIPNRKAA